ncbi:MAG: tetratricopeptide repeat protein [Planctomycetota bacterium]|nr:MAG: tetratricopeptide repeat protein [Planctomycetota bacterium]
MMTDRKLAFAAALWAAALFLTPAVSRADAPAKLVPFPEDAADPAANSAPAQPTKPKPAFQPRFRSPNVIQAQHLEPAGEVTPAESEEPEQAEALQPTPAEKPAEPSAKAEGPELLVPTPAAEQLSGKAALQDAFARSKTAESEADYTAIIDLCRRGQEAELSPAYAKYAKQLLGWAYNRRGEARAEAGSDADALADFEKAVELSGAWRALHNRGVSYAALGRIEEAMADFDRAIKLNPSYSNAFFNRGELRYRQGDDAGAIEDYTRSLELGSPDAATFNSRGHAYYRMKRFGDALRDYGAAVELDPKNPDPLINRGDAYSDLGQYGEAAEDYRNAVKIAPENARAYQAAAWLMATCPDAHYRDDQLAIDAATRAVELGGETYRNLTTLAAAQASAGKFDEALASQDKAISAAAEEDVATGEKMMSLYQRQIAFRDRAVTSFKTPEEIEDSEIQRTAVGERFGLGPKPPEAERAIYQQPAAPGPGYAQPAGGIMQGQSGRLPPPRYSNPGQAVPPQRQPRQQPPPPKRARLFAPRGKI